MSKELLRRTLLGRRLRTARAAVVAIPIAFASPLAAAKLALGRHGNGQPVLLQLDGAHCRQQLPPVYVLNGALYMATRAFLLREQAFIAPDTVGYVMPAERSVDIDTPLDWQCAEFLMEQQA